MNPIKEINQKMPKMDIKGKDYVQVKDRILALAEGFDYEIESNYQYLPEQRLWVVKSTLTLHKDGRPRKYVGMAQEVESDDYKKVNHTSALENAETSAVGRACAMAGIGVLDSIASVDEINKSTNRTLQPPPLPSASSGSIDGLVTVTIKGIYSNPKSGSKGPYWQVVLDTLERGRMSCLFDQEEFIPKWSSGEQVQVWLSQNKQYLNWSLPNSH